MDYREAPELIGAVVGTLVSRDEPDDDTVVLLTHHQPLRCQTTTNTHTNESPFPIQQHR